MSEYLEATYDKFTFRVRTDLRYSRDDLWACKRDGRVTVGLTDFLQRRSGDVAFVDLPALDTGVVTGKQCCTLDTIKATVEIVSPLTGRVVAVNTELEDHPELINEEPYDQGWLFAVEPDDPQAIDTQMLDAQAYFEWMVSRLEQESKRLGH
jgi:glycine cleavage system H protein